jgi:hypothetical protein
MLEYPSDARQKIIFSDDSRIVLGDDGRWVWYRRGKDNLSATRTTAKYPPSPMAFAVIGVGFKSKLLIIVGTVNAERYRRNIDTLAFMNDLDQLHGLLQWIFEQNGALAHTARNTVAWLGHIYTVLAGWPPNSPELSPIELCWAVLKKTVTFLMPTTIEQLKEIGAHAWEQIPQRSIYLLCLSFLARLLLCWERGGFSVSNELSGIGEFQALWDTWRDENPPMHPKTPEEDQLIIDLNLQYGNCQKKIAIFFEDRTPIQVKDRWHSTLKHRQHVSLLDTQAMLDKGPGRAHASVCRKFCANAYIIAISCCLQ